MKLVFSSKWCKNCLLVVGSKATQNPTFQKNDTKLYVPVVTLSTQENIKIIKQLESCFKRTINWNKYLPKTTNQARIRYLDFLIDPSFQGVTILFVLLFENDNGRESYRQYYLPIAEIKDYMIMINGRNFFDHPINNDLITYDNIRKITKGQGEDYPAGCTLDYPYFKDYYKLIWTDLSKQQKLDADPKQKIKQINFTGNLENDATIFFIIEEDKEAVLCFSKGIVKILWFDFALM